MAGLLIGRMLRSRVAEFGTDESREPKQGSVDNINFERSGEQQR